MDPDQFFLNFSSIDAKSASFLLNRFAKLKCSKQEILGLGINCMGNELSFCGIDSGYIDKEKFKERNDRLYLDDEYVVINLPENIIFNDKYQENNCEYMDELKS